MRAFLVFRAVTTARLARITLRWADGLVTRADEWLKEVDR